MRTADDRPPCCNNATAALAVDRQWTDRGAKAGQAVTRRGHWHAFPSNWTSGIGNRLRLIADGRVRWHGQRRVLQHGPVARRPPAGPERRPRARLAGPDGVALCAAIGIAVALVAASGAGRARAGRQGHCCRRHSMGSSFKARRAG